MKGFLCCFKGRGSNQVVQEPPEPPVPPPPLPLEPSEPSEPTDSSESIYSEDDELDDEHPLGINEFRNDSWSDNIELHGDRYLLESSSSSPPLLSYSGVTFRWPEILHGTENLLITHFLGRGNFGEVYRCNFPRISKVGAAKIQDLENAYVHPEFLAEITTLHSANHPNVIKLLGKCFGRKHRVIVYEFMPRGSLNHHIFAHASPGPGILEEPQSLDWDTRMRIAVGVAEALVYLHEGIKKIHRDVKASNILLDDDFVPKLSDFGLATKIVKDKDGVEQQRVISPVKGTLGYMPPEMEDSGLVSTRSDVYSYGVFLLTLFTGRKAYDIERPPETRKITDWLMPVWSGEEYMPLVVDATLGNRFSVEGIIRLFQAARMCVDPHVLGRPEMGFVESLVREAAAYPVPEWLPMTQRRSI